MAVTETQERKVVVFNWDTNVVHGETAEILAKNPETDADFVSKKHFLNDGEGYLAFPSDYTGTCEVLVRGSESGEDSGSLEVGESTTG
jgi:hypothetical protein